MRVLGVVLFAVGCSSSNAASVGDAATENETETSGSVDDAGANDADAVDSADDVALAYPAFLPNAPREGSSGGAVLAKPRVVPVFFAGDPEQTTIESFLGKLAGSTYWKTIAAPYAIAAPVVAPSIVVASAAPAKMLDPDLSAFLAKNLDGTHPEWGSADPSAIYAVFFPATTTFGIAGTISCVSIGGYHSHASAGATDVIYAAIPRCASFAGFHGLDVTTIATSHELIEAATDPFWDNDQSAFAVVDDDHFVWEVEPGAEIGDLCDNFADVYFKDETIGAMVERIWSNDLAAQGHSPCAPRAADRAYFNAVPVLDESVIFSLGGQSKRTKGVRIPAGSSKTIDVKLFSDAATPAPWKVTARTVQETPSSLDFSFDRDTGLNGDVLHLTITAKRKGAFGGSVFQLTSTLAGHGNIWIGFVAN